MSTTEDTITLADIEKATKAYSESRGGLSNCIATLNEEIDALKKQHMPLIKRALNRTAEKHLALDAMLKASPELFVKPRSVIFHGIKVGYAKGKGGIGFDSAEAVIKLIEKHFPDQADVLIKTKKTPIKKALANLEVGQLKKLGCTVLDTGDVAFITAVDSEVEKLVDALLGNATQEAEGDE